MPLLIYTEDTVLAEELRDSAPAGVTVDIKKLTLFAAGDHDILMLALSIARDVAVGVVSAWIYDRVSKKKDCRIEYRHKKVECEEHLIRRTIEEEIEVTHSGDANEKT